MYSNTSKCQKILKFEIEQLVHSFFGSLGPKADGPQDGFLAVFVTGAGGGLSEFPMAGKSSEEDDQGAPLTTKPLSSCVLEVGCR